MYFIFAKKDLDKNMDLYHTTEKNQDPFQKQLLILRKKKRCASGIVLFPFCMDQLHKFSPSDAEPHEVLSDFALVQFFLCTFDPAEVIISAFYVDTCCVNFDMDININMLMPKSEGVGGEKFDQNFATFY